jgi:hypothetical protein
MIAVLIGSLLMKSVFVEMWHWMLDGINFVNQHT